MSAWRHQTLSEQIKQTQKERRNSAAKDFFGELVLGAAIAFAIIGGVLFFSWLACK